MDLTKIFEERITRQEDLLRETAFQFEDETDEEFKAKVARRVSIACLGIGHARQYPGINAICPGLNANWKGFRINRRRVDQLDNIYISREK